MEISIIISLGGVITTISLFCVAAWKLSSWKHKLDDLEPLRKHVGGIISMMEKINEIHSSMIARHGKPLAESQSPISLTDYGKDIAKQINANDLVNKYANDLYNNMTGLNAYQIQEYCFDFSENKLLGKLEENDKVYFNKISDVAYENGIAVENIMKMVVGIALRDKILEMSGKSHKEVDDNAPADK